jgi:hypothetical protein
METFEEAAPPPTQQHTYREDWWLMEELTKLEIFGRKTKFVNFGTGL